MQFESFICLCSHFCYSEAFGISLFLGTFSAIKASLSLKLFLIFHLLNCSAEFKIALHWNLEKTVPKAFSQQYPLC